MKLEEQLNRLDEILQKFDDEELPLDDSFSLYEEGIGIIRACNKRLEEAAARIEELNGNDIK